jgi:hypothetical protein
MLHLPLSRAAAAGSCVLLLGLAGCSGDVSRTFGLTRDTPDEFVVTTRAPLSMPPNYNLRPPQPGATRPQEMTAQQAAEADLAPQTALRTGSPSGVTAGEQAFLNAAGPPAPADIRQKVNSDFAHDTSGDSVTDKLMFWKPPKPGPGVVVDPTKEAERLRANAALGQSADQGTTPIIQEKKSFWDKFF